MRRRTFVGWLALPCAGGMAIADEVPQADVPAPVPMGAMPDRPDQAPPPLAQGRASWYGGQRWHGRRTASGERFDRHALTAAHRSLPFGTWLRVVNLANGREVHVRINDRGPFGKRFIIDLSEAAAEQLGFRSAGTAQVRLYLADAPDTHQSGR
jgi:rare lipoprotein A